jgi:hypothetical protein
MDERTSSVSQAAATQQTPPDLLFSPYQARPVRPAAPDRDGPADKVARATAG